MSWWTQGRRKLLPSGRALVGDLLHYGKKVPAHPVIRHIDVPELAALRRRVRPRIGWSTILMKAYAVVCRRHVELRQTYLSFPWPHLYEHKDNIGMLVIRRRYGDGTRLFFARFASPEVRPLAALQRKLDHYNETPIGAIRQFRHQVTFSRLPSILRRIGWRMLLHLSPTKRVHNLGTFAMSANSGKGSEGILLMAPVTTILGYGVLSREGRSRLVLSFDHRVIDGAEVADCLNELEEVLRGPMTQEMQALAANRPTEQDWAGDAVDPHPEIQPAGATRSTRLADC